jgi:hypothetical protein
MSRSILRRCVIWIHGTVQIAELDPQSEKNLVFESLIHRGDWKRVVLRNQMSDSQRKQLRICKISMTDS